MIGAPDDNYRPSNYYCRVRGTSACGNVGAVNILYGTANGLNAAGDQFFNQNSSGIEELAQTGDEFEALSLGDPNSDGFLDLVIGAPGETINGHNDAGATHILYGNANGISAAGDEILHVDQDAFTGNAETNGHLSRSGTYVPPTGDRLTRSNHIRRPKRRSSVLLPISTCFKKNST